MFYFQNASLSEIVLLRTLFSAGTSSSSFPSEIDTEQKTQKLSLLIMLIVS